MPWWLWSLLALALAFPMLSGGIYFWGCAAWSALLTMGATLIFPGLNAWSQFGLWAIASVVHVALWASWRGRQFSLPSAAIGRRGVVPNKLEAFDRGWVELDQPLQGQQRWPCMCATALPAGTAVVVIELGPQWLKVVDQTEPSPFGLSLSKPGSGPNGNPGFNVAVGNNANLR